MDRYRIGEKLGKGAFGDVFVGIHKETGEKFALKRLRGPCTWETTNALREIQSLIRINKHPSIVELVEVHLNDQMVVLVFEYMPNGNLNDLIMTRKQAKQIVRPDEIQAMAVQVLQGLAHLHRSGYIHRDIKPDNILRSSTGYKIADFSLARGQHEAGDDLTSYIATRWYRSPEVLLCREYGTAMDVFAVGCLVAELYELRPLFPGQSEVDQIHRIVSVLGCPPNTTLLGSLHPRESLRERLPHASESGLDLVLGLLHVDPVERLSAEEALHHSFLRVKPSLRNPYK